MRGHPAISRPSTRTPVFSPYGLCVGCGGYLSRSLRSSSSRTRCRLRSRAASRATATRDAISTYLTRCSDAFPSGGPSGAHQTALVVRRNHIIGYAATTKSRARASATLDTVGPIADGGLGDGRNAFSFSSARERNERPNTVAVPGLCRRRSPRKADVASLRCRRDRERFWQRQRAENVPRANSCYRRDQGRFWPTNIPAP